MRNVSRYLIPVGLIVVVIGIIAYRYHEYILEQNFVLSSHVSCDPSVEQCFAMDCTLDETGECDDTPYKKVELFAADAPTCVQEQNCESFSCNTERSCEVTHCTEESLTEGEICAPLEDGDGVSDSLIDSETAEAENNDQ